MERCFACCSNFCTIAVADFPLSPLVVLPARRCGELFFVISLGARGPRPVGLALGD
jgi:hypothetical protein